jgi:hypothetical protein
VRGAGSEPDYFLSGHVHQLPFLDENGAVKRIGRTTLLVPRAYSLDIYRRSRREIFTPISKLLHSNPSITRIGSLTCGLVFRFRLLSTPPLNDAVTFSYGQASVPVRRGLSPFCWCVLSGAPFPGTSCQATIAPSLRDKPLRADALCRIRREGPGQASSLRHFVP